MCALANTWAATTPHGTCSWHSATLTPDLARSDSCVTLPGLLGGTAISALLTANVTGDLALPGLTTWSMFLGAAEANTSAGAPWLIWLARVELAPKLNVTFVPGWAASNWWPSVVNVSVSDAAANTVIDPLRLAAPLEPPPAAAEDGAPVSAGPLLDEPHAASVAASGTAISSTGRRTRIGHLLGISTTTFVDLTAAMAVTPGSSSSSSAASRLI